MTTVKKPLRVYADTSVFGGCLDDEFKAESVRFFEFEKIVGYEGVNSLRGYRSPRIYSPREVVTP
jgi:hypothetical protein